MKFLVVMIFLLTSNASFAQLNDDIGFLGYNKFDNVALNTPTVLELKFNKIPHDFRTVKISPWNYDTPDEDKCIFKAAYDTWPNINQFVEHNRRTGITTISLPGFFYQKNVIGYAEKLKKREAINCQVRNWVLTVQRGTDYTLNYNRSMDPEYNSEDVVRVSSNLKVYHYPKTFGVGQNLFRFRQVEARGKCSGPRVWGSHPAKILGIHASKKGDYRISLHAQNIRKGVECIYHMPDSVYPKKGWLIVPSWSNYVYGSYRGSKCTISAGSSSSNADYRGNISNRNYMYTYNSGLDEPTRFSKYPFLRTHDRWFLQHYIPRFAVFQSCSRGDLIKPTASSVLTLNDVYFIGPKGKNPLRDAWKRVISNR